MDKKFLVLGGVSLVSAALGSVGGYYYAREKLIQKYDAILEEEKEALKQHYLVFKKADEFESPEEAVRRLIPEQLAKQVPDEVSDETLQRVADGLKRQQYDKMYKPTGEPAVKVPDVHKAVFEPEGVLVEPASIFDDVVVKMGDPDEVGDEVAGYALGFNDVKDTKPFVISKEDYFENDPENDQVQWIYWAGDQVLMDEARHPVLDVNQAVGVRNLGQFGNGSGDKRIVYVRNQARDMDYEILFHEGKYSEEVAGFVPDATNFQRGLHLQDDDE